MSNTGVKLSTWGTHLGAGNGMLNFADKQMFGGNVGHASLSVTFPANNQTKEWIRKYCLDPAIPFEKQTIFFNQNLKENNGKTNEEVYVVHFSWFPGDEHEKYSLNKNINNDAASEHAGLNAEWNSKYKDAFQPEQRMHKGTFGESLMTYGVNNITHERNLNAEEKEYLHLKARDHLLEYQDNSLEVALKSIETNKHKISKNTILVLNRLVPGWKEECRFDGANPLSEDSMQKLKDKIGKVKELNYSERESIYFRKVELIGTTVGSAYEKVQFLEDLIEKKKSNLENLNRMIGANPLVEAHHRSALLLQREIKKLEKNVVELTKGDNYKYEHINKVEIKDWEKTAGSINSLLQDNLDNDSDRITIPGILKLDLELAFGHMVDKNLPSYKMNQMKNKTHWHNNHVKIHNGEFRTFTQEEAVALQRFAKEQIMNLKMKAFDIQPAVDSITQGGFENYISTGKPPDNELHLSAIIDGKDPTQKGLNVESMLKEMHAITVDSKEFNLKNNNCSVTVGRVLAAGAEGPHLKSIFEDRALGAIGNPQMVFNNALKYQESDKNSKDSFLKVINRNSPIEMAGGWCLKTLTDKNKSTSKKVAAGFAIVPIGIAAGSIAAIKKATNPLKSFNELRNFVGYANSRPSKGFKVAVTAFSLPIFAVLAIPAGIQKAAKSFSNGLSNIYKKYVSKTLDQTLQEKNVDLQGKDISKGLSFESNLSDKLRISVVEIKGNTVKEVMINFKKALVESNGPVVLDSKTEKLFKKSLNKIKDPKTRELISQQYDALCQVSLERVVNIQKQELIEQGIVLGDKQKKVDEGLLEPVSETVTEKMVLVEAAQYKDVEQFYSVMPLLGDELAQQIESYSMFSEVKSHLTDEQKALGLPRSVNPEDVKNHNGYLVSEDERLHIIDLFKQDSSLQEIKQGTRFPAGHPLEGQTLSCDAFKDNHGAVYVMNPMILGQGGFGTVKVIQAIDIPENGSQIKEKGFYVVKIQNIDNSDEDHNLETIRKEMGFNEDFGMHFGDMVINHKVMVSAPKYKLESDNDAELIENSKDKNLDNPAQTVHEPSEDDSLAFSTTAVKNDDDFSSFPTTDVKNDDDFSSFSTTDVKNDDEFSSFSTTDVKNDDDSSFSSIAVHFDDDGPSISSMSGPSDKKTEIKDGVPFFLNRDLITETAEETAARLGADKNVPGTPTLEQMILQQKPPTQVMCQGDISEFDLQKYLSLFEKMAEAVENVHNKGVLHRDIKAENFLYDAEKGDLRLIDFGCSRRINDPNLKSPYKMCVGTAHNFSPEHFHKDYKEKISTKQDMYALGRTCGLLMYKDLRRYNNSAYREDIPTPAVPDYLKEDIQTDFFENFRFSNESNDPHVDSINQMMQLMSELTELDVSKRPEASEVRMRLQALIQRQKIGNENEQNIFEANSLQPSLVVEHGNPDSNLQASQVGFAVVSNNSTKKADINSVSNNQLADDMILNQNIDFEGQVPPVPVGPKVKSTSSSFLSSRNSYVQQAKDKEVAPVLVQAHTSLSEIKSFLSVDDNSRGLKIKEVISKKDSLRLKMVDPATNVYIKKSESDDVVFLSDKPIKFETMKQICDIALATAKPGDEFDLSKTDPALAKDIHAYLEEKIAHKYSLDPTVQKPVIVGYTPSPALEVRAHINS